MKTLRNIYSHLIYCNVWAQNINTVRRLIILQKRAFQVMNFKAQLFHSNPHLSLNNNLKLGDKITSENIPFVSKSINRPSLLYFMIGLHFQETYIGMKLAGL